MHFLHDLLSGVDISDIAIISGITNMVKAIISVINNTPLNTYPITKYTDSLNRYIPHFRGKCGGDGANVGVGAGGGGGGEGGGALCCSLLFVDTHTMH